VLVLRRLCLAVIAAALVLPAAGAQAATTAANVWVVPSGGSSSCVRSAAAVTLAGAPASARCSSVQAAVSAMAGGDVALVASGSYANANVSNVTKSPAVTVKVEPGGTANVGGTTWVGANGVKLDGTEGANGQGWSTASGFTVGSNGGAAVKNFSFAGGVIHDAGGGAVLYMTGCDNVAISHLEIKNITGADGIQMANFTGQPWCTNVVFDDIYMHDFNATCGVDHQDGVQIRSGANITFTNSRIIKLNNCGSQGFFANQEGDLGGNNTTLSNTVIAGINGNAINFSSKPPQRMINNTIDGGLNTCQPVSATCTGVVMKNNVFNTSCGGLALYHNRVQNSADWANNINTANCGYSGQGDSVTPGFNAMFVAPASPSYDYHLKPGAYPIGKASVLDFTPKDFDYGTRDGAPDAGADEYGSAGSGTPAPPTNPTPPAGDTTAPDTTITSAPANGTSTSASVAFTATESGSSFECKLDAGAWAACSSPKAFSGLSTGSHTVSVRATDAAGNVDASPATATWTVSTPTSTPPPTTPPPTTPAGLVAAYGFNETTGTTARDATGHGLNGTIAGATSTAYGKFGRALSFDGDHDMVTIADNNQLDLTTGMTLEAWVAPTTTSGWRTVLAKEQSGGLTYGLYSSSDNAGKPSVDVFTKSEIPTYGSAALPTGTWAHLAATYNGSTVTLFVNGNAVSTKAVTGSMVTSWGALRIGGTSVWGEWFKGKVDEVRIYNAALTATQIKADMTKAI
jgi:hypothetical protein